MKETNEKSEPTRMGLVRFLFFILGVPFTIVFMLGDILAAPLDKYRHTNLFVWMVWNILRMSVPIAIIMIVVVRVIMKFKQ